MCYPCCWEERACAYVSQNICSCDNIQRALWISPVPHAVISLPWHDYNRENKVSGGWSFTICWFLFHLLKKQVPKSLMWKHWTCKQTLLYNLLLLLFFLLKNLCFCNFSSPVTLQRDVKSQDVCKMNRSDSINYHLFLFFCHFWESSLHFLCPCVPSTSVPVWLDLKGQLEGWQPSLTSEGWESRERSGMERDESKNCRWGRAGREF